MYAVTLQGDDDDVSMARCDKGSWQKAHSESKLSSMFGHKRQTSTSPLPDRGIDRWEIVGTEIQLTYLLANL